jgi:hypothetical protein
MCVFVAACGICDLVWMRIKPQKISDFARGRGGCQKIRGRVLARRLCWPCYRGQKLKNVKTRLEEMNTVSLFIFGCACRFIK